MATGSAPTTGTFVPVPDLYASVFGHPVGSDTLTPSSTNVPQQPQFAWFPNEELDSLQTQYAQTFAPPGKSTGDWLLHMAGLPLSNDPTPTPLPSMPVSTAPSSSPRGMEIPDASKGLHVFSEQYALERSVYASEQLLEILKHDRLLVNPWLGCDNCLIAYVHLMQALNLNTEMADDPAWDGNPLPPPPHHHHHQPPPIQPSFDPDPFDPLHGHPTNTKVNMGVYPAVPAPAQPPPPPSSKSSLSHALVVVPPPYNTRPHHHHTPHHHQPIEPPDRHLILKNLWHRVRSTRDALVRQAQHWDMVIPMAEEVQVCLRTSQSLFETVDDDDDDLP